MTILEELALLPSKAWLANTPVVSYSLRNYIGNNVNELGEVPTTLKEYKEAILKVINYGHLYKNMRESVQKHYSYEKIAERIDFVLKELNKNKSN